MQPSVQGPYQSVSETAPPMQHHQNFQRQHVCPAQIHLCSLQSGEKPPNQYHAKFPPVSPGTAWAAVGAGAVDDVEGAAMSVAVVVSGSRSMGPAAAEGVERVRHRRFSRRIASAARKINKASSSIVLRSACKLTS